MTHCGIGGPRRDHDERSARAAPAEFGMPLPRSCPGKRSRQSDIDLVQARVLHLRSGIRGSQIEIADVHSYPMWPATPAHSGAVKDEEQLFVWFAKGDRSGDGVSGAVELKDGLPRRLLSRPAPDQRRGGQAGRIQCEQAGRHGSDSQGVAASGHPSLRTIRVAPAGTMSSGRTQLS